MTVQIPLKLIDNIGYDYKELSKLLKRQGRLKEWQEFYIGQTGAISEDGKFLVYPCDVIRFVNKDMYFD